MLGNNILIKSPYDGAAIPGEFWLPVEGSARGVYLMLHGLGSNKDEYLSFYADAAKALAASGYASLRIDFRAHGESAAPVEEFTILNCTADALASAKWLKEAMPDIPLSLFGTSFGAAPAILSASAMPEWFLKLRLLAPILDLSDLYLRPTHQVRMSYRDLRKIALAEASRHPLDEHRSFDFMNVLEFSSINLAGLVREQRVPTKIMHGTSDTVVPYEGTVKCLENSAVYLDTFERMDHGYTDINDPDGKSESSLKNFKRIVANLIE